MNYFRKVIRHIKQGTLRDIWQETRWIYRYAKAYWGKILLYIFLGLIAIAISLGNSLLSRRLINLVVAGAQDRTVIRAAIPLACLFVGLALLKIGLGAFNSRLSTKVNLQVNREIRADVFGKFLNTGWRSISGYHSGDLLNRLNSDVSTVAGSVLGWIPSLITSTVQFLGVLAVIVYFDPVMALLALCSVPVTAAAFGALTPRLRRYSQDVLASSSALTAFHSDALQNIQSVKAFGLVDRFGKQQEALQEEYVRLSLRQNKLSVTVNALMSLLGMVVSYLCLGWGVYRLWSGRIDFGTMVLFIQLAAYLSSSANSLLQLGPRIIGATVAAKRIMSILELPRENAEPTPAVDALRQAEGGVGVALKGISFSYRKDPVLQDASFEAAPGEVVAVVGPSGAGKTTLLRLLLSLIPVSSGEATLESRSQSLPLTPQTRTLFSYVPQEKALFSGTVAETLQMVKPDAAEQELWDALELAEVADVVRAMPQGLQSPIGQDGGSLSEGQGQRLSIARALLHNGPILLLDEATSALDVATERRILRNIMEKYKNKTCIVTTHRPTVLSMCTRVYQIQSHGLAVLNQEEIQKLLQEF